MKPNKTVLLLLFSSLFLVAEAGKKEKISQWTCFETTLESRISYTNPIYDLTLEVVFTSPSGNQYKTEGFWDGGNTWKIRFMPNEKGKWNYQTHCSDSKNKKLHRQKGTFNCKENKSSFAIYSKGKIQHRPGDYHLTYSDGSPFFFLGCTAWNGAMHSTDEEWETYLQHRKRHDYTVIQFVATQWRGLPAEALEQVAFFGEKEIAINPLFFQQLDKKIERINALGLVASPVMLWAWKDSPGSSLSTPNAIRLAKYIKARYDSYHVIWFLGGDGDYTGNNESKWKEIGRTLFGEKNDHQNIVTLHPKGRSWYANDYDKEEWLDMISYQTGHANSESAVRWKTEGPVVKNWKQLTPRPIIDTEPVYETQGEKGNHYEVRKSTLWSIFSAPVAGVAYGAWSTWPWLRVGEKSFSHGMKKPSEYSWEDGMNSAGSIQVGKLHSFFAQFNWWQLRPSTEELLIQEENKNVFHTIMVLSDVNERTILAYTPVSQTIRLKHTNTKSFQKARWYYPATGLYETAKLTYGTTFVEATQTNNMDAILILETK